VLTHLSINKIAPAVIMLGAFLLSVILSDYANLLGEWIAERVNSQ
jgi:hypothetical protein